MSQIVGIRFRRAGRVYYFHAAGLGLAVDDEVVVQTTQGIEIGKVVISPPQVILSELTEPLKPVLRKANDNDRNQLEILLNKKKEAMTKCKELIAKFELPMKLLSAEWSLDESHISFLFSAEERVDFRVLVRELTKLFKTKVELRQVGARDEAKLIGGFGRCGRSLCCASYLTNFESVSMKMAKEQELPLNPAKISGVCGRLLCCLGYESALYKEMKEKLPRVGQIVDTPQGEGKVIQSNPIKEAVVVQLESQAIVEIRLSDLVPQSEHEVKPRRKKKRKS